MNTEFLLRNWALVAALVLLSIVAVVLFLTVARRSGRGRLAARAAEFRTARQQLKRATQQATKLERRLQALLYRADRVKPSLVDECRGRLDDARALAKIADDKVLIAANQLRKVIVAEFPPVRHEALRRRYLREAPGEEGPFSFDGRGT